MSIQVFDDILNNQEINHIENFLRDPKFPWFLSVGYNHYTVDKTTYEKNIVENRGELIVLTHVFYLDSVRNSDNYLLSDFILTRFLDRTKINFTKLIRSKSNLQLSSKDNKLHTTPHIDNLDKHKVVIYYANDSDGDTFFFDEKLTVINRITPRRGRFILFDGDILHAAGFNVESDIRLNINFNFI